MPPFSFWETVKLFSRTQFYPAIEAYTKRLQAKDEATRRLREERAFNTASIVTPVFTSFLLARRASQESKAMTIALVSSMNELSASNRAITTALLDKLKQTERALEFSEKTCVLLREKLVNLKRKVDRMEKEKEEEKTRMKGKEKEKEDSP